MKSVFQQLFFNVNIRLCRLIRDYFLLLSHKTLTMGKGDKKTKKGKRHIGSTGVVRPKKKVAVKKAAPKKAAPKKAAPKKAAAKKKEA
jgi:ribosomal small subunit protein bTHX